MLNKHMLIGRLGQDPEVKESNGKPWASVSVATEDWVKQEKVTTWHRVLVFGRAAETLRDHARKGQLVYLEGRVEIKVDNDKKVSVRTVADFLRLLGGEQMGQAAPRPAPQPEARPAWARPPADQRPPAPHQWQPPAPIQDGGGLDDGLPF